MPKIEILLNVMPEVINRASRTD